MIERNNEKGSSQRRRRRQRNLCVFVCGPCIEKYIVEHLNVLCTCVLAGF